MSQSNFFLGILDVFQKYLNEERSITVVRPIARSVNLADESVASTADIMTPAIDNRKAARELVLPTPQQEVSIDAIFDDLNQSNITTICSNQTQSIMRAKSETCTSTAVKKLVLEALETTPYSEPTAVPSNDSELQLESLDLNSYESFNVSPLTPSTTPGAASIDQPILSRRTSSDALPFDELETSVKLPDFPAAITEQKPKVVESPDAETKLESVVSTTIASAYEDDDTITSATSSFISSLDTEDTSYMEEQAGYLSQFADAAMYGDVSLFTSLVNEIIDSAKNAAKLVVTTNGDNIDDQGPIKIGDNYYTHQEAIRKWKKARDKLNDSKYKNKDEKLQRKLEKAAMDAAQLMAATKTFDLAARRSGHHMEKKEQKQALKALSKMNNKASGGERDENEIEKIRNLSDTSTWEREELENILSREAEKERKKSKETKDPLADSIHHLINQFSLFGFSLDGAERNVKSDSAENESNEQPSPSTPTNTRFDFLRGPSNDSAVSELNDGVQSKHVDEDMIQVNNMEEFKFQYLTRSMQEEEDEDEPFDCIDDKKRNNPSTHLAQSPEISSSKPGDDNLDHGRQACVEENIDEFTYPEPSVEERPEVPPETEQTENEDLDVFPSQEPQLYYGSYSEEEHELEQKDLSQSNLTIRASSPSFSTYSRSVASPSPATLTQVSYASSTGMVTNATNASSITELAGCCVKSRSINDVFCATSRVDDIMEATEKDAQHYKVNVGNTEEDHSNECIDHNAPTIELESHCRETVEVEHLGSNYEISADIKQLDFHVKENAEILKPESDEMQSVASKVSNDTTASSTKGSAESEDLNEDFHHNVEAESFYSGDHSGILSGESAYDQSGVLSGDSTCTGTTTSESGYTSLNSLMLTNRASARPSTNGMDSQPATILEEAVCFLIEACPGEIMSECPSAHSKYTMDSVIGSEYGTEIIFNQKANPPPTQKYPQPLHDQKRIVTERKPRITSKQKKPVVTPSPTKNGKSGSPKGKRINPLKLITKSQSSKKAAKMLETTQAKEASDSSSRPETPASARSPTPKGLKMGFGMMRSRSS